MIQKKVTTAATREPSKAPFKQWTNHLAYRSWLMGKYQVHPLEHFLKILNAPDGDKNVPASRRDDAAKAAAPYLHPRLNNIEIAETTSGQKHSVDYSKLNDEELATFEKILTKCAVNTKPVAPENDSSKH